MTIEQFYEMVNRRSGLLGISETSADMRRLAGSAGERPARRKRIELFLLPCTEMARRVHGGPGRAGDAGLQRRDRRALAEIRARICEGLEYLGVFVDPEKNAANAPVISTAAGPVQVRVMRTEEELMIAKSVFQLLKGK